MFGTDQLHKKKMLFHKKKMLFNQISLAPSSIEILHITLLDNIKCDLSIKPYLKLSA